MAGENAGTTEAKKVIYVNGNADTAGDGSSWQSAYSDLNAAIQAAQPGDEIWAQGGQTYTPTPTTDRKISFAMKEGVNILGGFAGNETSAGQRDYQANPTVLSGDIGQAGVKEDNTEHVVTLANNATLDGFTIKDGYAIPSGGGQPPMGGQPPADGTQPPAGGAPPLDGGQPPMGGQPPAGGQPPPNLTPETIINSNGEGAGANVLNLRTNGTVKNAIIENGTAIKGGGVYNVGESEQGGATYDNVTIRNNKAEIRGGGMSNDAASVQITNSKINDNVVSSDGREVGKGGGIYNDLGSAVKGKGVDISNSEIMRNSSDGGGGGIANDGGYSPVISGSTITNNKAADEGGGLYFGTGESNNGKLTNNVIKDNTAGAGGNDIYTWHDNKPEIKNDQKPGEINPTDNKSRETNPTTAVDNPSAGQRVVYVVSNEDHQPEMGGPGQHPSMEGPGQPPMRRPGHRPEMGGPGQHPSMEGPGQPPMRRPGHRPEMGGPGQHPSMEGPGQPPMRRPGHRPEMGGPGQHPSMEGQTGKSWETPYTDLSDALEDANKDGAQVWAKGKFTPTGNGRDATFKLENGTKIYGGFTGKEKSLDERNKNDWSQPTILSGDIGRKGDNSDNAYHVVTAAGNGVGLDSVKVSDGNANGTGYNSHGGGIINYADKAQGRPDQEKGYSVSVNNSAVMDNTATDGGGAYLYGASNSTFTDSLLVNNKAENGGAVVARVGANTTFDNTRLFNNHAKYNGGGFYNDYGSQAIFKNKTEFRQNTAGVDGGGYYSVTRAAQLGETKGTFDSALFFGNSAGRNGGAANIHDRSSAAFTHFEGSGNIDKSGLNNQGLSTTGGGTITGVPLPKDQAVASLSNATGSGMKI